MWVKSGFDWSTYHHRLCFIMQRERERETVLGWRPCWKENTTTFTDAPDRDGRRRRPRLSEWTHEKKKNKTKKTLEPDFPGLKKNVNIHHSVPYDGNAVYHIVTESLWENIIKKDFLNLEWLESEKLERKLNMWWGSSDWMFWFLLTGWIWKNMINFNAPLLTCSITTNRKIKNPHLEIAIKPLFRSTQRS